METTKTIYPSQIKGVKTLKELKEIADNDNWQTASEYNRKTEASSLYRELAKEHFLSVVDALNECREWYDKHGIDYEIGLPYCFIKAKKVLNTIKL